MVALRVTLTILLAALIGCGSNDEASTSEPADSGDHGAGSVLWMDPALDAIVPTDYRIEKLADGMVFTEGPVWVRDGGYLLFCDVRGNAIYRWAPAEGLMDFLKPVFSGGGEGSVGPSGLAVDGSGNLFVCEQGNRRISRLRLGRGGQLGAVVDRYEEKALNSPNDLVLKSDGWLYFTDPPFGLPLQDQDPAKSLVFNGVFRLSPDRRTLELLVSDLSRPNGIAFSPDEKTLYISNADPDQKLWMAYDVRKDGLLENGRVFYDAGSETSEGLPDGLKVDKQGNVFASGPGGVWIFSPAGVHLGTIQPDEPPANVAWGDDGRTLYITARTGLYRIRLNTEGFAP
jgi:gluconolactonase